jgi:transposase InsO family protein
MTMTKVSSDGPARPTGPAPGRRLAPAVEAAVIEVALEQPAWGPMRVAEELARRGLAISPAGVRSVWSRHDLLIAPKRLRALEVEVARARRASPARRAALAQAVADREAHGEFSSMCPADCGAQDTLFVATLEDGTHVYQQSLLDTYSLLAFTALYSSPAPRTAVDLLRRQVVPFLAGHGLRLRRVFTDRGVEYCGAAGRHPFARHVKRARILHTPARTAGVQTNVLCEGFHRTVLDECHLPAFRRRPRLTLPALAAELAAWTRRYNEERPQPGAACRGRTPLATFLAGVPLARQRLSA